jgi:hypothetical protein
VTGADPGDEDDVYLSGGAEGGEGVPDGGKERQQLRR